MALPTPAAKAELARIGRYGATESMPVPDPPTGRYDAAATPCSGRETLLDRAEFRARHAVMFWQSWPSRSSPLSMQ